MSISRKYGRTFHFPFSPGATNDDRINFDYWSNLQEIKTIVYTEKLDGENTCLNQYGVFARSHAAPTRHPWANYLKERWHLIRRDLGELEIFGENLYAIHSIEYRELEQHFYVFGIREGDQWLSWEAVQYYAALIDFPTVPELKMGTVPDDSSVLEQDLTSCAKQSSTFYSVSAQDHQACSMEGIVCRNSLGYSVKDFPKHVFKYVRANHVQTDQHWTRNWKRAALKWER